MRSKLTIHQGLPMLMRELYKTIGFQKNTKDVNKEAEEPSELKELSEQKEAIDTTHDPVFYIMMSLTEKEKTELKQLIAEEHYAFTSLKDACFQRAFSTDSILKRGGQYVQSYVVEVSLNNPDLSNKSDRIYLRKLDEFVYFMKLDSTAAQNSKVLSVISPEVAATRAFFDDGDKLIKTLNEKEFYLFVPLKKELSKIEEQKSLTSEAKIQAVWDLSADKQYQKEIYNALCSIVRPAVDDAVTKQRKNYETKVIATPTRLSP